ncbi:helix-turn-helix transcriptional regulator [Streptomyces sp. RerS4]|uniref:telomere-associated protein Tap n=1 Tax=Streptomyces sp. RerS4 TaxID=2942449 RepID=UPI00201BAF4D|nr:helix-turn-helix transcriptional regulator [Streptomyces sp. RerS4]UQX05299.1 helix-turn-helix domain-containing protein [Streptomyces sp. RerS4]
MSDKNEQSTLFAAVDALLEEAAAQDGLPHPDERKRLREAAGLSQDQIAKALSVRRETVTSWETGRTAPRPPKRAAYARLLEGLSTLHPPTTPLNAVNTPHPNDPPVNAVNPQTSDVTPTPNAPHTPPPTTSGTGAAHAVTPPPLTPHIVNAPTPAPTPPRAVPPTLNAVNPTPPAPAAPAAPPAPPAVNAVNAPTLAAAPASPPTVNAVNPQTPTPPPATSPAVNPTPPAPAAPSAPAAPAAPPAPPAVNAVNATPPHPAAPTPPAAPPTLNGVNAVNAPTPAPAATPERAAPEHALARAAGAAHRTTPPGSTPPGSGAQPQFREGAGRGTAPQGHPTPRPRQAHPTPTPLEGNGPLVVLNGTDHAHAASGLLLPLPPKARTDLPTLITWALGPTADLRAPRLHRNGRDGDPLLVLTPAATEALGLPLTLEDRRTLRLPDNHPTLKLLTKAKWQLTRRGFGPWARVYRPATPTTGRQCVQLAILPWGALDPRAWGEGTAELPAPELADILTTYATRVLTPRGSTAVTGLELMTALRPPTRAARNPRTNAWESAPVPGSLTHPVDPAPPEAPDEHPVVAALYPRSHQRTPDQVLDEEAYDWIRDPELLTDAECARTHAVGIDVNMAFAAAANRLPVGLGPAVHTERPRFDPKTPGCWLADLSALPHDPLLPSPFTPHGRPPTGPAWYATPTLAYAQELGHDVHPTEAWIRPDNGPYLDAWYTRLRDAYMATMADLGVTPTLTEAEFLQAMTTHKSATHPTDDPTAATARAVLSAIKSTVKGGIGKLRERPQGAGYRPGEPWPALERPTWRPDIRAAVISTARVNMHRKMLKLSTVGLHPIAVLSDCAVYLSDGPSPLDFLPHTPEGKPLPGGFRLGVSPGMVKHEGTQPLLWAVGLLDEHINPARHIKGHDAAADGE